MQDEADGYVGNNSPNVRCYFPSRGGTFTITDGFQILGYCRERHVGGDTGRSQKQRDVLMQMWDNVKKMSLKEQYELAEAVIDFAAGRPHADWLAIPRTNTGPGAPAGRIIRALLEMEPSTQQNLSAFHAWYFRSRALAAFGLLLRRRHSPDLPCSRALLELSRHPEPAPARGGDVRPDVLAGMLVEEAALARRAGDMETALILAELAALAR